MTEGIWLVLATTIVYYAKETQEKSICKVHNHVCCVNRLFHKYGFTIVSAEPIVLLKAILFQLRVSAQVIPQNRISE